jgi:WD40 repeat protein
VRRGLASMFLDPRPHDIELRTKTEGNGLWSEYVFAAEMSQDGVVVLITIEEENVESPSGLIPSLHVGRPVLVDGHSGSHMVDLDGCDFFRHIEDNEDVPIEPGTDCHGDGFPVLDYTSFEFSADGTRVLGATTLGASTIWDTETGRVVSHLDANRTRPNLFGQGVRWAAALSPDGREQVVPPSQDDWETEVLPSMSVVDVASGDELGSFEIDHWANFSRFTPSGDRLIVAGTDLLVVDTDTWAADVLERPQGARITDLALSPAGRLAATAGQDDVVSVWDVEARALLAEIPVLGDIGTAINGVAFLDDDTILVAPQSGGPLLRFTIDSNELIDIAFDSLNRGFTEAECAAYEIEPCPTTLDEMRSGS